MARLKTRLLPIIGMAVGILTVRRLRNRRSKSESIGIGDQPETSTEHAATAAEHARLAAEKAVKKQDKN